MRLPPARIRVVTAAEMAAIDRAAIEGRGGPSLVLMERAGKGVAPSQTIMVGDWPERDVVGASKLGIRTAFARYGDTFGTQHSGADWDLDDVHDLVGIVDRLNGTS